MASNATNLLTSIDYVRLSHPESGGWIQASANSDKGSILDFAEGEYERAEVSGKAHSQCLLRERGAPAHVPYVKVSPSMEGQYSAKGVWALELVDRTTSNPVLWRSLLRLRHIASGKYLAVDSFKPAAAALLHNTQNALSGTDDKEINLSNDKKTASLNNPTSNVLYDAGLVAAADASLAPGTLGSAESMVFYLTPSGVPHDNVLPKSTITACIEHRPPPKSHAAQRYERIRSGPNSDTCALYLSASINELKPQIEGAPQYIGKNAMRAKKEPSVIEGGEFIVGKTSKMRGLRLLFGLEQSPDDALKVVPVQNRDARALDACLSRLATLKLYRHLTILRVDANQEGYLMLQENIAKTCFGILADVAKDGLLAKSGAQTASDLLKLATTSKSEFCYQR